MPANPIATTKAPYPSVSSINPEKLEKKTHQMQELSTAKYKKNLNLFNSPIQQPTQKQW